MGCMDEDNALVIGVSGKVTKEISSMGRPKERIDMERKDETHQKSYLKKCPTTDSIPTWITLQLIIVT